jgi:hypothetical protein
MYGHTYYVRSLYRQLEESIDEQPRSLADNMTNSCSCSADSDDAFRKIAEYRKLIRLYQPNTVPYGLADELRMCFADKDEVYRIYLLRAIHPRDNVPFWLILVDFNGDRTAVFTAAIKITHKYMKKGEIFVVMQADGCMLRKAMKCSLPICHKLTLLENRMSE